MPDALIYINPAGISHLRRGTYPRDASGGERVLRGATVASRMSWWDAETSQGIRQNFLFRIDATGNGNDPGGSSSPGNSWIKLGTESDGLEEITERLSVVTAAFMALSDLEELVLARPQSSEAEIQRCARWTKSTFLRPFTGRGARLRVIEPWLQYLDRYSDLLLRIRESWTNCVLPLSEAAEGNGASVLLLKSLELIDPDRDIELVIPELANRLERLKRQTEDISDDIGHLGTLGTLGSLVFRSPVLAGAIAGTAVVLYYSGFGIAMFGVRIKEFLNRLRSGNGESAPGQTGSPVPAPGSSLAEPLARLADSEILVGVNGLLSPAEASASLRLWLRLLTAGSTNPLAEVKVSSDLRGADSPDTVAVLVGGPIVRVQHPRHWNFECDIFKDEDGWFLRPGPGGKIRADSSESTGFISGGDHGVSDGPDLILVCGFRDTGGVRALRRLGELVETPDTTVTENGFLIVE